MICTVASTFKRSATNLPMVATQASDVVDLEMTLRVTKNIFEVFNISFLKNFPSIISKYRVLTSLDVNQSGHQGCKSLA